MKSPQDMRYDHFRQLYFEERSRRESIRSSISTPVAAISFAVFALGNLARDFDFARWNEPVALGIIFLAVAATLSLLGAVYQAVMVEWLFLHHETPPLDELLRAEALLRERTGDERLSEQMADLMIASYSIAYEQHLGGNTLSARSRTRALRFVLAALFSLALAFLLLPIHLAGG
ncbi:hypothetical protein [Telmatospirillum sp. J64-1]|uniref:hypothetical protein n=1 Tax=Telmatospirillum sp. J64-1 TaxID=2502183 RepID=UPI00115F2EC9|nr:hypothetical protein [Telmatospirillum sp. J64-1]